MAFDPEAEFNPDLEQMTRVHTGVKRHGRSSPRSSSPRRPQQTTRKKLKDQTKQQIQHTAMPKL